MKIKWSKRLDTQVVWNKEKRFVSCEDCELAGLGEKKVKESTADNQCGSEATDKMGKGFGFKERVVLKMIIKVSYQCIYV